MNNSIFLALEGVVGETTGEKYDGTFKLVKYLTNKERSTVSRYLEMLCKDIERDTNTVVLNQAIAYLKTHVVEAPKWWTESEGGLNLLDSEPVFQLYTKLLEAQKPPKQEEKVAETTPT